MYERFIKADTPHLQLFVYSAATWRDSRMSGSWFFNMLETLILFSVNTHTHESRFQAAAPWSSVLCYCFDWGIKRVSYKTATWRITREGWFAQKKREEKKIVVAMSSLCLPGSLDFIHSRKTEIGFCCGFFRHASVHKEHLSVQTSVFDDDLISDLFCYCFPARLLQWGELYSVIKKKICE